MGVWGTRCGSCAEGEVSRGGGGVVCGSSVELCAALHVLISSGAPSHGAALQAYSQSKLALNMWSFMLAAKLHKARHPAVVHCIDPGAAATKVPEQRLELRAEHLASGLLVWCQQLNWFTAWRAQQF